VRATITLSDGRHLALAWVSADFCLSLSIARQGDISWLDILGASLRFALQLNSLAAGIFHHTWVHISKHAGGVFEAMIQ
jgi:hypothetical protein